VRYQNALLAHQNPPKRLAVAPGGAIDQRSSLGLSEPAGQGFHEELPDIAHAIAE
jgi:hypothetical protein